MFPFGKQQEILDFLSTTNQEGNRRDIVYRRRRSLIPSEKWDEQLFRKRETDSHEEDDAASYRRSPAQAVPGQADDWH